MVIYDCTCQNITTKTGAMVTKSNNLGEAIKAARERSGLSVADLSDLLGMKAHSYRRYERDEVPLKATTLIEIAQHLNVSLDVLAELKKPNPDDQEIIYQKIPSKKGTKIIFVVE